MKRYLFVFFSDLYLFSNTNANIRSADSFAHHIAKFTWYIINGGGEKQSKLLRLVNVYFMQNELRKIKKRKKIEHT